MKSLTILFFLLIVSNIHAQSYTLDELKKLSDKNPNLITLFSYGEYGPLKASEKISYSGDTVIDLTFLDKNILEVSKHSAAPRHPAEKKYVSLFFKWGQINDSLYLLNISAYDVRQEDGLFLFNTNSKSGVKLATIVGGVDNIFMSNNKIIIDHTTGSRPDYLNYYQYFSILTIGETIYDVNIETLQRKVLM